MDNFSSGLIFLCVPATMDGVKSKTCKITPIAKMLPLCNFATVSVQGWTGQIAWSGSKRKLVSCLKSQACCWTWLHYTGWELGWPGNNIQYTIYCMQEITGSLQLGEEPHCSYTLQTLWSVFGWENAGLGLWCLHSTLLHHDSVSGARRGWLGDSTPATDRTLNLELKMYQHYLLFLVHFTSTLPHMNSQ